MKGIVVEINNKEAVILSDNGLFQKMKNSGYEVGQIVKCNPKKSSVSRLAAGVSGLAAALIICTIGAFAYQVPTDYVSLDVNPSIEFSVNRFDRILSVKAVNDDGEEILSDMDLNHKTIEEGIRKTLDRLVEGKYINDDPYGKVVITTSNDKPDDAEKLAARLERTVRIYLDRKGNASVEVDAEAVRPERVQEAKLQGVTPGKLRLVEKLQQSTGKEMEQEEWEEWLAMPVKDINKAIKENRKLEKDKIEKDQNESRQEQDDAVKAVSETSGKSSEKKAEAALNAQNKNADTQEVKDSGNDNKGKNSNNSDNKGKDNNNGNDNNGKDNNSSQNSDEKKKDMESGVEKKTDKGSIEGKEINKNSGEDKKADKGPSEDKKADKDSRSEGKNPGNGGNQ